MATSYPTALDTLTNPTANDSLNSPSVPHATQHANANDAIEALQATVGITNSSNPASLQKRIAVLESNSATTSSPTFTGTPVAPTAAPGTVSTQIATTAFVQRAVSGRVIDPRFLAHRGGLLSVVENSLSGFRWAISAGIADLEFDCYLLADGEIGVMHDSTVDRTTTSSGSTSSFNGTSWKSLVLKPSAQFTWGTWPTEAPPLFWEVLNLVIAHPWVRIWPEGKNTYAVEAIVNELHRYNLGADRAIIQVGSSADAQVALDGGFYSAYQVDPSSANFSQLYAVGVRYITWASFTTQQLADIHSAGLQAIIYDKERRVDIDQLIIAGVDKFIVNDPLWSARSTSPRLRSAFRRNRFEPGYFGNGGSSYWPTFFSDGSIGWASAPSSFRGQLQGWACPIKGDVDADSFTITLDLQFTAVNSDTKWFSIFVCSNTDGLWGDLGANSVVSGYHVLCRRNGGTAIYRQTAGQVAASIGSLSGSTLNLTTYYQVVLTVTPTQISIKLGSGSTLTVSDATYRGGYFHFGCSEAAVQIKNVVIT